MLPIHNASSLICAFPEHPKSYVLNIYVLDIPYVENQQSKETGLYDEGDVFLLSQLGARG